MFVQSEKFVTAHGGIINDLSIYGQESNPTTWKLAKMEIMRRSKPTDVIVEGTQGTITLAGDGSMTVELRGSGTTDTVHGTYALEGPSLTMTIESQTAKGSMAWDGGDVIPRFSTIDDEPVELE